MVVGEVFYTRRKCCFQKMKMKHETVCAGGGLPPLPILLSLTDTARDAGQAVAVELLSELSGQDISTRYRRMPGCIPVSCNVYKCFLRQQR